MCTRMLYALACNMDGFFHTQLAILIDLPWSASMAFMEGNRWYHYWAAASGMVPSQMNSVEACPNAIASPRLDSRLLDSSKACCTGTSRGLQAPVLRLKLGRYRKSLNLHQMLHMDKGKQYSLNQFCVDSVYRPRKA